MRLRELLTDTRAVSEVLGVILMITVTAIIASIVATFVLDIGTQKAVAPQASFSTEYSPSTNGIDGRDGNLTITHESGDAIVVDELYLGGENIQQSNESTWEDFDGAGNGTKATATASGSIDGRSAVVASDHATIGADRGYKLRIVWQARNSTESATLYEEEG